MKKHLISLLSLLSLTVSAGAQTIHFEGGSTMDMSTDKLILIIPKGDSIQLNRESGESFIFPLAAIDSIDWAAEPSAVSELAADGAIVIAYSEKAQEVTISGIEIDGNTPACIFNPEGKLIATEKRNRFSVANLHQGLYIINIENKSNAKFIKK